MVSGVSFRNPNTDKVKHRKTKLASASLIFAFVVLVSIVATYGIAFYIKKQTEVKLANVIKEVEDIEAQIKKGVAENSHKAFSVLAVEYNLFKKQGLEKILTELGNGMVPRVVLISLDYSEEKKRDDSGTNMHVIMITGDAETDDALSAQIRSWKGNETFTKVKVADISTDEETGRKVFTAELILEEDVDPSKRPFGV